MQSHDAVRSAQQGEPRLPRQAAPGNGLPVGRGRSARRHPAAALFVVLALTIACGGSPPAAPTATTAPAPMSPIGAPTPGGGPELVPGGFDIERVRLMDPAELPEGIPVPVPYGGEIDTSIGTFEGQSLAVEYDPRFFRTAAAFYATWIQMEGLEASPLISFTDSAVGWQVMIEGEPVRLEISLSPDGTKTQLAIYWD